MSAHAFTLDAKTKILIAAVALGVVAGQVVTFIGGLANTTGWDIVKFPCECAWAVLAFPFGWLGLVVSAFARFRWFLPYPHLFLWTGIIMNGCLWSWIVYRVVRSVRGQETHHGFHASTLSVRLTEVRQSHVAAAHTRAGPVYARKGLVAIASRVVRRCGYFLDRKPEARQYAEGEMHKNEP